MQERNALLASGAYAGFYGSSGVLQVRMKTAIITGAGHGIGQALALAFVQAGWKVCVTDLRRIDGTVALLGADNALGLEGDVTETAFPARVVEATVARFGRLDCIVSNAADQRGTTLEETPIALFDAIQAVNVRAPYLFAQAGLEHLKVTQGSIINMGSLVGNQPIPERVAYSTSKAALAGLTRALATDLGRYGVRVNCIAPGHIMTKGEETWREQFSPEEQRVFFSHYPLERVGHPHEIATVALFLASDAASFITGATIPVDGGMGILCPETGAFRAAQVRWPGNPGGK